MRASLSGAADVFNDLTEMRRIVREMLEGVSAYTEQLVAARQEADEAYMRINSTVEQMEIVSRQESGYLKSVGALQANIAQSTDELTAALDKLSDRFAENTGKAAAGMQKASSTPRWMPTAITSINSPSGLTTFPPTFPARWSTCPAP